jgi:hypothetical protein
VRCSESKESGMRAMEMDGSRWPNATCPVIVESLKMTF